tara:strand:+ start:171 stop:305 length:135 start_codon:yes stop_codon:yes gene_type:complete
MIRDSQSSIAAIHERDRESKNKNKVKEIDEDSFIIPNHEILPIP